MGVDHDDTAANGFKFRCAGLDNNETIDEYSPGDGPYGEWGAWSDVHENYLVCGV